MKIYFAGSITGGRDDQTLYLSIIAELQKYGSVLTEHVGDKDVTPLGEINHTSVEIYERDMGWIKEADLIVAEVTTPSLGVGYELAQAEMLKKPTLCLFREREGHRLSAMIAGNSNFIINKYQDIEGVKTLLGDYFELAGIKVLGRN